MGCTGSRSMGCTGSVFSNPDYDTDGGEAATTPTTHDPLSTPSITVPPPTARLNDVEEEVEKEPEDDSLEITTGGTNENHPHPIQEVQQEDVLILNQALPVQPHSHHSTTSSLSSASSNKSLVASDMPSKKPSSRASTSDNSPVKNSSQETGSPPLPGLIQDDNTTVCEAGDNREGSPKGYSSKTNDPQQKIPATDQLSKELTTAHHNDLDTRANNEIECVPPADQDDASITPPSKEISKWSDEKEPQDEGESFWCPATNERN